MNLDLATISSGLIHSDEGIWISRADREALSYPAEGYDMLAEIEADSFWFRHRNAVLAAVMQNFPPAGTFFDVGGGTGFVTQAIEKAGYEVVLIEPAIAGARHGKHRGLSHVVCATLQAAGFREHSLPAIGAFDVVEHIEDDAAIFAEFHRHLIPGGRLYLTVPTFRLLWSVEDDYAGHFRRYTIAEMQRKLTAAGFVVDYASYFFSFLALPVFLLRSVPSRLGLRRQVTAEQTAKEHSAPKRGLGSRYLDWRMKRELATISAKRRLAWGSSCIVVAHTPKES